MPRGNLGKLAAFGLAFCVPVALLTGAPLLWSHGLSFEYEREANKQTAYYNANTGRETKYACGILSPVEKPNCLANAEAKVRENEREEQNLVAQRQSALWAYVMAVAAVIGMALSVIGVLLIWTTFRETRLANEIAGTGARAWLSVDLAFSGFGQPWISGELGNGFAFELAGKIENHGSAPASDVRLNANILFPKTGDDIRTPMHEFCDDWRQRLTGMEHSGGKVLFPKKCEEEMPHMLFISQTDIDAAISINQTKLIFPRVVGCISYRTPHASGVRQTRFMGFLSSGSKVLDLSIPNWWQSVTMDCLYTLAD